MGRSRKTLKVKRVQLRLSDRDLEILERYSVDQINDLMHTALNTITPGSGLGMPVTSILRPKSVCTETIARIGYANGLIGVFFPEKMEEFRQIIKIRCGYSWEGWRWERKVGEKNAGDRMAEVAYRLLEAGFIVQVEWSEVAAKIANNSYIPEALHLVKVFASGAYKDWFTFSYPRDEDQWYQKIMRLTAAKYEDGHLRIPPEHFAEVEDFAEHNGFHFTESARSVLEKWRQIRDVQQLIELKPRSKSGKTKKATMAQLDGIPEGLLDD